MAKYKVEQEVQPGTVETLTVEADDEEGAKSKARQEVGGYTVGIEPAKAAAKKDDDKPEPKKEEAKKDEPHSGPAK